MYFNVGVQSVYPLETTTFEVKKGEIAYLGELQLNHEAGLQTPQVANQYKRDILEFKKRSAFVNWDTAVNKSEQANL